MERLVLDDDDEEDRMQIVITDPRVFNARGQKILNKDGSRGGSIGDSNLIGKERFRPTDWLRQSPEKSNVPTRSLFATRLFARNQSQLLVRMAMGPPASAAATTLW